MTIREFIAQLQKLDQDRNIWLNYDCGYDVLIPEVEIAEEKIKEIEPGDYVINAW